MPKAGLIIGTGRKMNAPIVGAIGANLTYYFFVPDHNTIPPITITPIPIRGDQSTRWPLSAVISILPTSTTSSFVKNLKDVKMVNNNPIMSKTMPVAFITNF